MRIEALEPGAVEASHDKITRTTMEARGARLLHGVKPGDATPFSFRPPNLKTLRDLGKLKDRRDLAVRPGRFAAYYIAKALASFGEPGAAFGAELKPWGDLNDDGKAQVVGALPFGDVLFLLFYWKAHSSPKGYNLGPYGCVSCGLRTDALTVDLFELEAFAIEGISVEDPPRARVGLRHPIPVGEKATATTVMLRPPSWLGVLGELTGEQIFREEDLAFHTFKGAICGSDASDLSRLPDDSIDSLWPDDLELLQEALDKVIPAPDMKMRITCPGETCDQQHTRSLTWATPGFFPDSARA